VGRESGPLAIGLERRRLLAGAGIRSSVPRHKRGTGGFALGQARGSAPEKQPNENSSRGAAPDPLVERHSPARNRDNGNAAPLSLAFFGRQEFNSRAQFESWERQGAARLGEPPQMR
jgi:hypothetical protein